jgi:4-oxalomesaconate tautomerase
MFRGSEKAMNDPRTIIDTTAMNTQLGITGYEDGDTPDANTELKETIEAIRLAVGERMNLCNVTDKSVPKMMPATPPRHGGAITVRSFIPFRAHATIGVLGAVSVAKSIGR